MLDESKLTPSELEVKRDADYFVASRFLGSGRYQQVEADTIDTLRREVLTLGFPGRWLVYAVRHTNGDRSLFFRQAMVGVL